MRRQDYLKGLETDFLAATGVCLAAIFVIIAIQNQSIYLKLSLLSFSAAMPFLFSISLIAAALNSKDNKKIGVKAFEESKLLKFIGILGPTLMYLGVCLLIFYYSQLVLIVFLFATCICYLIVSYFVAQYVKEKT